ncbi:hypothetical protein ACFZAM_12490 [Streptomyces sp. NPDC008079]|uniref:hypothetical protein n=1 Tax=Streptomyces sp. NPDC008079 TaxID=3364806 RepID=UPI0036E7F3BC
MTPEEIAAVAAERDTARQELARLRVGLTKGLTPEQSARLRGADEAEMTADADALKAEFGAPPAPARPATGSGSDVNASGHMGIERGAALYRAKHGVDEDGVRVARYMPRSEMFG